MEIEHKWKRKKTAVEWCFSALPKQFPLNILYITMSDDAHSLSSEAPSSGKEGKPGRNDLHKEYLNRQL